jgi:hypothetical protein
MKPRTVVLLAVTHALVAAAGFAGGIYALPILIAPPAPSISEAQGAAAKAKFTGQFKRELKDSDALHWGEGAVSVGADFVVLQGRLAPGPDYKLYFSPEFVETEVDFKRLKSRMALAGDVKTFENFVVAVPASIDPAQYSTVIVWCESFGQFITAAKYR